MNIIGYVFIIIAIARLFAEFFERFGLPGFIGEIITGLLVGLMMPNLPREELNLLAEFGFFFLMVYAGLELTPEEVHYGGKKALPIYIITYLLMLLASTPFTNGINMESLLVASILSIASAPLVLRFSRFFGNEFLHVALSYAVISEISALVLLYLLTNFYLHHSYYEIALELIKDILFLGVVLGVNYVIEIKHKVMITKFLRSLKSDEAVFGLLMIVATSLALLSESIGLHFSVGAFFAGLIIHSDLVGTKQFKRVQTIVSGVTYGIFAPIFLAWRGINFRAEFSLDIFYFFIFVYIVRVLLTSGLTWTGHVKASLLRGTGIASFGVLGLLIGELGFEYGILGEHMYALVSIASIFGIFISALIARMLSKEE